MDPDALIEALSRDLPRLPRHALQRRLAVGVLLGAVASLALLVVGPGVRPDLGSALGGMHFWGKAAFALALAFVGAGLSSQLARPDSPRVRGLWLVAAGLLLAPATIEGDGGWSVGPRSVLLAPGWTPLLWIPLLALPVLAGLAWSFRRFAPADLQAAGAAVGLTAGGVGAAIYALHCASESPAHVLTLYSAAIAAAMLGGWALGPRLLKW